MAFRISAVAGKEQVRIQVSPVDPDGKPADIEAGSLTPVSAGPGTAVVDTNPAKPNSILCISDDVGQQTVTVTGDADLGAGVEDLTDSGIIDWVHPKATSLGMTVTTEPRTA